MVLNMSLGMTRRIERRMTMPKYIDAEKYINIIKDSIADSNTVGVGQSSMAKERLRAFEEVIKDLENLEAEDVMPIIHAEWVYGNTGYSCSNCLCENEFVNLSTCYCPSCGAKMDFGAIGTIEYKKGE